MTENYLYDALGNVREVRKNRHRVRFFVDLTSEMQS